MRWCIPLLFLALTGCDVLPDPDQDPERYLEALAVAVGMLALAITMLIRGRKSGAWAALPLVALTACTPMQRHTALVAVGAGACGAGKVATAADQSWGGIVEAIGCWLTDWSAERLDRLREAARKAEMESTAAQAAAAAELARIAEMEAHVRRLEEARADVLEHDCEEHRAAAAAALDDCKRARESLRAEESEP